MNQKERLWRHTAEIMTQSGVMWGLKEPTRIRCNVYNLRLPWTLPVYSNEQDSKVGVVGVFTSKTKTIFSSNKNLNAVANFC